MVTTNADKYHDVALVLQDTTSAALFYPVAEKQQLKPRRALNANAPGAAPSLSAAEKPEIDALDVQYRALTADEATTRKALQLETFGRSDDDLDEEEGGVALPAEDNE